jgi:anaerobic selenocysteine-containing dehydrogenase
MSAEDAGRRTRATVPSFCRNCLAYCPILVTVEDGCAVKVTGDPKARAFDGYTCPKGRALPAQHNDPARILRCLQRRPDGSLAEIHSADVVADVARRLRQLLACHGPRAIAMYSGTGPVSHPVGAPLARAFFRAIGSRMVFSAATIDKPAEHTSVALHGNWQAGLQTFETADTWLVVGANPVIAKSNGGPLNNPGVRLKEALERGMKLIVIDPRRTETARRAHVHLQARPGEDPTLLAGILHILLEEDLVDHAFVQENAQGLDVLRAAVREFTPGYVAERAGVPVEALLDAAHAFGRGRRGGVVCSTGPSFATRSNLTYYLALCINTLCGRWVRAGELAPFPNVLLPAFTPTAQPWGPYPVLTERPMRVGGLFENASGIPTAALSDEILQDGEGRIRALFCLGGNPVLAWPDQLRTEAALKKLDLLVVFDYQMTATARFARYVVPPPLSHQLPGTTQRVESLKYSGVSRGYPFPWAQYTPPVVPAPAGSDLVDDGTFFFLLAQEMGLALEWVNPRGQGPNAEGPSPGIPLDMHRVPTAQDMIELSCRNSRVPLAEVQAHPHGNIFDVEVPVAPRDPACTARLELGATQMMDELRALRAEEPLSATDPQFPLLLLCRRANNFMNSVGQTLPPLTGGQSLPPAALHSEDLAALALQEGEVVRIRSRAGHMRARIGADDSLRRGTVSVVHGFGAPATLESTDPVLAEASVNRVVDLSERDPITGIPRMTGVPVAVERLE